MTSTSNVFIRGGSRNFGRGAVRGRSPEPSADGKPPQKILKNSISCNLASDTIQNGAFAEQKTVAATISIYTHIHTPPTLPKTPRISATIKSKFNFKQIFSDIVYNVDNKIDFAKNRGPGLPWICPCSSLYENKSLVKLVRRYDQYF